MTAHLTHLEAIRRLAQGLPLEACTISGPLLLGEEPLGDGHQTVRRPLTFRGVEVQELIAACVVFEAPVRLVDCVILGTTFYAAYFLRGLEIRGCTFLCPVSFAAGGHNDPGCPAVLSDTVFEGFVDFDDCYFTGPVEVVGCTFRDGSNLLFYARPPCGVGEGASLRVADNRGRLDLIAEGPP